MTIPIVQGQAVESSGVSYQQAPQYVASAAGGGGGSRYEQAMAVNDNNDSTYIYSHQELQQKRQELQSGGAAPQRYQDVAWAVAFWVHLVVIIAVVIFLFGSGQDGGNAYNAYNNANAGGGVSFVSVAWVSGVCGLVSAAASAAALQFMMRNAESLIQTALIFSICMSGAVGILGFMTGSILMGVVGLLSFAVGICYAYMVWARIPFAAANLKTALTAVRANMGLAAVAYMFMAVAFGWSLLWMFGVGNAMAGQTLVVVFFLFLSYYWVHQVLSNTVHVTAVGVVGTWWFVPEEASAFWSPALNDSLKRATTTSFGSICFGSFLVALVQALRALERYARGNDDMSFLVCIIQCILACIQGIIEYLNKWAYVYVGLYGMSYLEAGRNVFTLFQQKGWTVIITDDLTDNVLGMMAVAIGLVTGLVGLLLGTANRNLFAGMGWDDAAGPGFLVGFLVGFLMANILMSVVGSAVNTVIVCYAEAPAEFQMNHPQLAGEMRQAWVQAWPGVVQ